MSLLINDRSAVHQASGGVLTTTSVNYTGSKRKPVAYQNIALSKDATNTSQNICSNGYPLCHKQSYFSKSIGDEAGNGGGINSGTINGKAEFLTYSSNVFFNGIAAVRDQDKMVSNSGNTAPQPLQQGGRGTNSPMNALQNKQIDTLDDYYIPWDILGPQHIPLNRLLSYKQNNTSHNLSLDSHCSENAPRSDTRRVLIPHLKQQQTDVWIKHSIGQMAQLPLGQNIKPTRGEPWKVRLFLHCLVPLQFRWATNPPEGSIHPGKQDYSDIARLPSTMREKIYAYFAKQGWPDDWLGQLPEPLKSMVKQQLKPYHEPKLRTGWVYIYRDGYLWQECQVVTGGQLQDVDLCKESGKDQRNSTGRKFHFVLLPYTVNGLEVILEVAYSEIQWSWNRIEYFGGMDPKDERYQGKTQDVNYHSAQQRRLSRFQRINLGPLWTGEQDHSPRDVIINHDNKHMPVALLSDPLGFAQNAYYDLLGTWLDFLSLYQDTMNTSFNPFFHSALLTYRIFFNDEIAYYKGMTLDEAFSFNINSMSPSAFPIINQLDNETKPNVFKKAQNDLDYPRIDDTLKITKRKILRERIQHLQNNLVTLIQDKTYLKHSHSIRHEGIDTNDALQDFFAAEQGAYKQGFITIAGFMSLLHIDPNTVDHRLNNPSDNKPITTYGNAYILSLFEEAHILNSSLFPSQPSASTANPATPGDGQFSPANFSMNFNPLKLPANQRALLQESLGVFSEALDTIITSSISAMKEATDKQRLPITTTLVSLAKATGHDLLQELKATIADQIPEGYEIVGINEGSIRRFNERQAKKYTGKLYKNKPMSHSMEGQVQSTQEPFSTIGKPIKLPPLFYKNNTGMNLQDFMTPSELMNTLQTNLARFNGCVIIQPTQPQNPSWYSHNKAISSMLFSFSLLNVYEAMHALLKSLPQEQPSLDTLLNPIAATCFLLYSMEETLSIFVDKNHEELGILLTKWHLNPKSFSALFERIGFNMTPLTLAGVLGNFIGLFMGMQAIYQDTLWTQSNSLIGHTLVTAGNALEVLNIAGQASQRFFTSHSLKGSDETPFMEGGEVGEDVTVSEAFGTGEGFEFFSLARLLMPFNTVGFIASIAVIVGTISIILTQPSPIIEWAKRSPFNRKKKSSMSNYVAVESLLTLLIHPTLTMNKLSSGDPEQTLIRLDITLPWFVEGRSRLDVRFTAGWYETTFKAGVPFSPDYITLDNKQTQRLAPYKIRQKMDPKTGQITGMEYFYCPTFKLPHTTIEQSLTVYCLAKARLYFDENNYMVPNSTGTDPAESADDSDFIADASRDSTWIYADPLTIYP